MGTELIQDTVNASNIDAWQAEHNATLAIGPHPDSIAALRAEVERLRAERDRAMACHEETAEKLNGYIFLAGDLTRERDLWEARCCAAVWLIPGDVRLEKLREATERMGNLQEAKRERDEARAVAARLRLFLSEISGMGPADEEWDEDTLADAVALAKRGLNEQEGDGK